jgi:hypothetical protein
MPHHGDQRELIHELFSLADDGQFVSYLVNTWLQSQETYEEIGLPLRINLPSNNCQSPNHFQSDFGASYSCHSVLDCL